jgi:hypothetical protein
MPNLEIRTKPKPLKLLRQFRNGVTADWTYT